MKSAFQPPHASMALFCTEVWKSAKLAYWEACPIWMTIGAYLSPNSRSWSAPSAGGTTE